MRTLGGVVIAPSVMNDLSNDRTEQLNVAVALLAFYVLPPSASHVPLSFAVVHLDKEVNGFVTYSTKSEEKTHPLVTATAGSPRPQQRHPHIP